jgi:hypothetical protein
MTKCGSVCVNTQNDQAHCGGCQQACTAPAGGTVGCSGGTCVPSCPGGQILCGSACVNPSSSNQHCGGCNQQCTNERTCQGGSCQCPAGQPVPCVTSCEPQCCPASGACAPPTGGTCQSNGTCGCPAGKQLCSGVCAECCSAGDCSKGNSTCQGGVCACPSGWNDCGTDCCPGACNC